MPQADRELLPPWIADQPDPLSPGEYDSFRGSPPSDRLKHASSICDAVNFLLVGKNPYMRVIATELPEVLIVEPKLFGDQRGFFLETYELNRYVKHGVTRPFVQDSLSRSSFGVVRGLHLQNPQTQGKLVTVLRGRALDVAVDVRVGSSNFGRHVAVELSEDNRKQVWIPRGFAHGFAVLSETVDFFYKCDGAYSPKDEISVRWNDPAIGIDWRIPNPTLSAKDATAPLLADVQNLPQYGEV